MGIYIKGMEMPTGNNEIIIRIQSDGRVLDQYGHHLNLEPTAIPVPPHGRGIDADALLNKHFGKMYFEKVMTATKEEMNIALTNIPLVINNAPTIIEAEEGE